MIRTPGHPDAGRCLVCLDPVSAAISGGSSLLGGLLNSRASSSAASTEAKAASAAAQSLGQAGGAAQTFLNPYVAGGSSAYKDLLTNPTYSSTSTNYLDNAYDSYTQASNENNQAIGALGNEGSILGTLSQGINEQTLQNTPGYQFTLGQGLQSTQNSAAARGLGVSGAALKGAATYATGLADQTYQNQYQNLLSTAQQYGAQAQGFEGAGQAQQGVAAGYLGVNSSYQGNLTNTFNRQNTEAGYGLSAAQGSAGNALTAAGASNSAALSGASALAGGITGSTGAITGGLTNAANQYQQYQLYQNLLNGGGGIYGGSAASSPFGSVP